MLFLRLPRAGAGRLRLSVPGDVELRGGASVSSRELDRPAGVTRFELLPTAGDATLVMSLNSHLQRREQAVVARSVLVDEVTAAYEKLHATVSLAILYRRGGPLPVRRARGLRDHRDHLAAVGPVGCPDRWRAEDRQRPLARADDRTVVLNIPAVRVPTPLAPEKTWQFPQWEPLDVKGHVAVLGLLAEQPLKVEALQPEGLIPIDAAVLSLAMPAGAAEPDAAGQPLRAVAAYYAPQGRFHLTGRFVKPPAALAVTANVLLILEDGGLRARGGWAMLPESRNDSASISRCQPDGRSSASPDPTGSRSCSSVTRRRAGRRGSTSACRGEFRRGRNIGPSSTPCGRRRVGRAIGRRRRSNFRPFPSSTPRARRAPWPWSPATT